MSEVFVSLMANTGSTRSQALTDNKNTMGFIVSHGQEYNVHIAQTFVIVEMLMRL